MAFSAKLSYNTFMESAALETLKEWLNISVFHNTVRAYAGACLVMLSLVLAMQLTKRVLLRQLERMAARTATDLDDFMLSLVSRIGAGTFIIVSLYVATRPLTLNSAMDHAVKYLLVIVLTVRVVIIIQQTIQYSIRKVYLRSHPSDPTAEALSKNITQVLSWALWALGVVFILDNLGVNISALMAGIGIGGIAVAMASQAILGDLFSAVSIFVDKPFVVGDFIIVGDLMGTVEQIGLKTTRIRSLYGEQLIFPNSELTKSRIRNYKRMEIRRVDFKLGIIYETPPEKVKKVPALVKEIFDHIQGVKLDRVHLLSFGDYALIYEVVYFVSSADYNVYMDRQQEINFALMDVFQKEDIRFAYPTQTLLTKKLDDEKAIPDVKSK